MKHSDRLHDEELHYLDTINRMTRQLHIQHSHDAAQKQVYMQMTVEDLEDELEVIRLHHEQTHHRR